MADINTAAGQFNRRITVQRLKANATINAAGHVDETDAANWETHCSLWASFRFGIGREVMTGEQVTSAFETTVFVRSSDASRAITQGMRIKYGTRTLSVSAVPFDLDEARKVVQLQAIEVRV